MPAPSPPAAAGSPEVGLGTCVLLGPGRPGDTLSEYLGCRVTPAKACFCHQAESACGFRQRWRAAGQRAEVPAGQWETQQTGVGRGEERTTLLGRGSGSGLGAESGERGQRIRVLAV